MKKDHDKDQSIGQFQELSQQYTIALIRDISIKYEPKKPLDIQKQQPKLKFITDPQELNTNKMINKIMKEKKHFSNNGKSIKVGDAIFRSNFQSGNIYSAKKMNKNTYEIQLENELNSERMSSWFYFSAEGIKGETTFIIKGFTKSTSLYNHGMKVCYREKLNDNKWKRGCSKIFYYEYEEENQSISYALTFSYFFKNQIPNIVEFAYCFPYTYSRLLQFLATNSQMIKTDTLGQTYEGRQIPILTIGNEKSNQVIVLSARAHPGETVGSLAMEGFLKELIAKTQYSEQLRENFLFKIIPMINPDGVVQGNYRFSAAGYDLNRKWKNCRQKLHPEVFLIRNMIKKLKFEKQVLMFIDLHGHSRQKNVFFYGCCPDSSQNMRAKEFPYLMSKLHPAYRYDHCCYKVQKDKEGTARISMWKELQTDFVYTLECSFCGSEGTQNYTEQDYEKIGSKLCKGIALHFSNLIAKKQNCSERKKELEMAQQLQDNMKQFFENPYWAKVQYENGSSDSEPEAGQIPEQRRLSKMTASQLQRAQKIKHRKIESLVMEKKQQTQISKIIKTQNQSSQRSRFDPSLRFAQFSKKESRIKSSKNNTKHEIDSKIKSDLFNSTFTDKLLFHKETQVFQSKQLISESLNRNYKSENTPADQSVHKDKNKSQFIKSTQYRRVRKLAQEHNRRHFSAKESKGEEASPFRAIVGAHGVIQGSRVISYVHHNVLDHGAGKKGIGMYFQRRIKASDYSNRNTPSQGDVKCEGRQIYN